MKKILFIAAILIAPILLARDGTVTVIDKLAPKNGAFQGIVDSSQTVTNTTNFNHNLSGADTDVQKALDTLDELVGGTGGGLIVPATFYWPGVKVESLTVYRDSGPTSATMTFTNNSTSSRFYNQVADGSGSFVIVVATIPDTGTIPSKSSAFYISPAGLSYSISKSPNPTINGLYVDGANAHMKSTTTFIGNLNAKGVTINGSSVSINIPLYIDNTIYASAGIYASTVTLHNNTNTQKAYYGVSELAQFGPAIANSYSYHQMAQDGPISGTYTQYVSTEPFNPAEPYVHSGKYGTEINQSNRSLYYLIIDPDLPDGYIDWWLDKTGMYVDKVPLFITNTSGDVVTRLNNSGSAVFFSSVTASEFWGDGSHLTGITATAVGGLAEPATYYWNLPYGVSAASVTSITDPLVLSPNPATESEFGSGSYMSGDVVSYRYYSYKDIGGTVFYSRVYSESIGGPLTIDYDGSGVYLNWESVAGADGYRILRDYNGAGFVEYQDTAGNTLSDDGSGFLAGNTVTPNGYVSGVTVSTGGPTYGLYTDGMLYAKELYGDGSHLTGVSTTGGGLTEPATYQWSLPKGASASTTTFTDSVSATNISTITIDFSSMDFGMAVMDFGDGTELGLPPKTYSQLVKLRPRRAGQAYYCTDCTIDGIVVSTGTGKGAFSRASWKSKAIDSAWPSGSGEPDGSGYALQPATVTIQADKGISASTAIIHNSDNTQKTYLGVNPAAPSGPDQLRSYQYTQAKDYSSSYATIISSLAFSDSYGWLPSGNYSSITQTPASISMYARDTTDMNGIEFYMDSLGVNISSGDFSLTNGSYIGDGSQLTGIVGDNLGNHTASEKLRAGYGVISSTVEAYADMGISPPSPNTESQFGTGSYQSGDTVSYRYYSYLTNSGVTYYSKTYTSGTPLTISGSGVGVFLNWEASASAPTGYIVVRSSNNVGFNMYQDIGGTTFSDDGTGWTSIINMERIGPLSGLNISTGAQSFGLYTEKDLYVGGYVRGDGSLLTNLPNQTAGLARAVIVSTTANSVTISTSNTVMLVNASAGGITINLPSATGNSGVSHVIKKIDSSSNYVTVDAYGSQTIDGELTQVIPWANVAITLICDGSNWYIL